MLGYDRTMYSWLLIRKRESYIASLAHLAKFRSGMKSLPFFSVKQLWRMLLV